MKYLLDVNALVALGHLHHEFHEPVVAWIKAENFPELATCPITELGFVRILSQVPAYGFTLAGAKSLLLQMKRNPALPLEFISDDRDIARLPGWVRSPAQTTDAHLADLAAAHGARLATLDEHIPGS
ncbi:MAG TPA: PIN domain-containing protein, partial [Silvibacterium sp.]|nr:PIN domain-containing protein [Silvibacterium sp.]